MCEHKKHDWIKQTSKTTLESLRTLQKYTEFHCSKCNKKIGAWHDCGTYIIPEELEKAIAEEETNNETTT